MAEQFTDYYRALGVPATATSEEIKEKYRFLALKYHPDRGGSARQMSMLNEAYSVLSSESLRANYDRVYERYYSRGSEGANEIERMNALVHVLVVAKRQAKANAIKGAVWLALGIVVTAIGYAIASPGSTYLVMWGAMLFGGYQFVVGLHHYFNPQLLVKKSVGVAAYQKIFAGVPVKRSWKAVWALAGLVVVVFIVAGVVGEYNNTHYPASYATNFLTSCQSKGASESACSCALNDLESKYTYAEAKVMDTDPQSSTSQNMVSTIVDDCRQNSSGDSSVPLQSGSQSDSSSSIPISSSPVSGNKKLAS